MQIRSTETATRTRSLDAAVASGLEPAAAPAPRSVAAPGPRLPSAAATRATASVANPALALQAPRRAEGAAAGGDEARLSVVVPLDSPEGIEAIQQSLAAVARRGFAQATYQPRSVVRDELGMTHVRLQQTHEGVPIFAEEIVAHIPAAQQGFAGSGVFLTGEPVATEALEAAPRPLRAVAGQQAVDAFLADLEGAAVEETTAEAVAYVDDGRLVRGTYVTVLGAADEGTPVRWHALVDAEGRLAQRWEEHLGISMPGVEALPAGPEESEAPHGFAGAADDNTLYSGRVALSTSRALRGYVLHDRTRGKGIETLDARGWAIGQVGAWFARDVRDDNDRWREPKDSDRQKAATDAHYGAMMTYDAYREVLGLRSIDLKDEKLVSKVHFGSKVVNAFWNGKEMRYGDGNGKLANALTTLDIAGHEITHGLTQRTAKLVYRGESGGLNEGMSDIAGVLVEWYASQRNPAVKFDWLLGEDAWTPNNGTDDGLRSLADPESDGRSIAHYSKYRSGIDVHYSSGIINNAFYQLAADGPDKRPNSVSRKMVEGGLGIEPAARIFFRALVHYLRPNSTFADARNATIRAATDLHGANSVEVQKVREAWSAVGVEG